MSTALDLTPATLDASASDWSMMRWHRPRGVFTPNSIEELAQVFRQASAAASSITTQGRRRSTAGQALSEGGLVVSTARLDRIVSITEHSVTVEAGLPWDRLVAKLLVRGLVPPVLTSYLPATIGGTLSTPAFSRGSHQHGLQLEQVEALEVVTADGRLVSCSPSEESWLFDAVLGGLGRFGTIARATLRLVAAPTHLRVLRCPLPSLEALPAALIEAASDPQTYHVTAFPKPTPAGVQWEFVQAVTAHPGDKGELVPFSDYAAPPRPEAPQRQAQWLHLLAPQEAWRPLLARYAAELSLAEGDGVQVLPVRKRRSLMASLARLPEVPDGALVAGICLVRELQGRDAAKLDAETRELYRFAASLGAVSTLGGTLPESASAWREHLGATADSVFQTLRRADPAGILGGVGTCSLR